jgi:hypothetical protein
MPVFPSGGRLTVNSDLPGCCMPTHGLFSSPAPLPFAGAVTMGGLTLAFDLSVRQTTTRRVGQADTWMRGIYSMDREVGDGHANTFPLPVLGFPGARTPMH